MGVTFHGGRNEQNFSENKAGLVLTALPPSAVPRPDMGDRFCTFSEDYVKAVTNFVKKQLHFF